MASRPRVVLTAKEIKRVQGRNAKRDYPTLYRFVNALTSKELTKKEKNRLTQLWLEMKADGIIKDGKFSRESYNASAKRAGSIVQTKGVNIPRYGPTAYDHFWAVIKGEDYGDYIAIREAESG